MARVVLKNITKTIGEHLIVKNLSLDIPDKEFFILVGPSGCGKSTTLRMIAGLEEITSGEILIDGRVVNHVRPKDRDIAMVFQNYALYPHMSVYENMAFGLKLRGYARSEIHQRVKEAADILTLGSYLERKPKALSGGQRQRVAVGRAIVRKPRVFLFDEPLSNLDAKLRVQMRLELSKLHERLKTTIIYVTHDQVEAMTMGDRICVMKDGEIQQVAPPLELYERPSNKFVAGFVGNPHELFPGYGGRGKKREHLAPSRLFHARGSQIASGRRSPPRGQRSRFRDSSRRPVRPSFLQLSRARPFQRQRCGRCGRTHGVGNLFVSESRYCRFGGPGSLLCESGGRQTHGTRLQPGTHAPL
ncbi:MAG: ATP-binding cassette domain-containing protein [Elusimicrobia bacterium]|nr:ATP-binding cassette domain-containing protein [Elusimicrobiota bacterium]